MPSKRKRDILDFDPNKSDSGDENFSPGSAKAPRSSRPRKKSRPSKGRKASTRKGRGNTYRGSDISDDDELQDSQDEDSFAEGGSDDDDGHDSDEDDFELSNGGRRVRKAAARQQNYKESSEEQEGEDVDEGSNHDMDSDRQTSARETRTGKGNSRSSGRQDRKRKPKDDSEEEDENQNQKKNEDQNENEDEDEKEDDQDDEMVEETPLPKSKAKKTKIIVLKINKNVTVNKTTSAKAPASAALTRRSTRARSQQADEELVELSNSGKHALPARASSNDPSPDPMGRAARTRSGKTLVKPNTSIIQELPEDSASQDFTSKSAARTVVDDTEMGQDDENKDEELEDQRVEVEDEEDESNPKPKPTQRPVDDPAEEMEEDAEHEEVSRHDHALDHPQGNGLDNAGDANSNENAGEDVVMDTIEPNDDDGDDDDDDVPLTRRTRASRVDQQEAEAEAGDAGDTADVDADADADAGTSQSQRGRRLTRRTKASKSQQEPSSDFDPGADSDGGHDSATDRAMDEDIDDDGDDDDADSSPKSRSRRTRAGTRSRTSRGASTRRSRRNQNDSAEELELDQDELAMEIKELRPSPRSRRAKRKVRKPSPEQIQYESRGRRNKNVVDYTIKQFNPFEEPQEEEEEAAPQPGQNPGGRRPRGRAGAGGANTSWVHSLHTLAGPFGGVGDGSTAAVSGPWGTGAAGGADSDSSDDEMIQRSGGGHGTAGHAGQTPNTATASGLLPGLAQPSGIDGPPGIAAPNVGKVKSQKALADADPLGVDANVDFSKVGGLQGHIDQLKEMVQLPLLYPELFLKFHVTPPRGVLFHGPPGTGKTLVARALANSVGIGGKKITFYMRKGADALSKWVGEAEKQLRLLFEEARRTQPSIIFFDEIDGLAPVRSSKQEQIHASIVSTLLALMDGMDGRGQVIVIGATNRPDNIDPALRRPGRFDREFYFPLPDMDARKSILDIHTKDWGISDDFKRALARDAKGYGGADLRALCTEAAMNSIQRTYPQIYAAQEKLIVDPDKITIHMTDFTISKKKIVPSSERASVSGATPLPKAVEPLLRDQLKHVKGILDDVLPRKKKVTALEEAMYEPYDDADGGFAREAMNEEFERSRVFRPRLLICGERGMGHAYLGPAIRHHLEGVHVQNFDLPSIFTDAQAPEQAIVGLFAEVRRRKPSVIFIPNVDTWYETLRGPALTAFLGMLRSIPPTDPIMVLGYAESRCEDVDPELRRDLFGFSRKNLIEIARPDKNKRQEYFTSIIDYIKKFPKEFPDPESRKKRVLEQLKVAPPPPLKVLTKEEERAEWLQYRQALNIMKVHLQPIMDQINRKYRKFRTPPIPQAMYQYLLDEQDTNFVRPDIPAIRQYELSEDKEGNGGLREVATNKFYYNLDIQTIEERLANGYYIKPRVFLKDVYTLEKDAKTMGDRERVVRASELVSNVEVDVLDIDQKLKAFDWDSMYQAEQGRRTARAEKARKKRALVEAAGLGFSDVGNDTMNTSQNGQHPHLRLYTNAPHHNNNHNTDFHAIGGTNDHTISTSTSHPTTSNGSLVPSRPVGEDSTMLDADLTSEFNPSPMPPPSRWAHPASRPYNIPPQPNLGPSQRQMSQISAVQPLPRNMSPFALQNDASTTKSTDPSQQSSNNWSTHATNGISDHGHHQTGSQGQSQADTTLPDTQPPYAGSQANHEESWMQPQNHGLLRGILNPPVSDSQSTSNTRSSQVPSVANLLNSDSSSSNHHPQQHQPPQQQQQQQQYTSQHQHQHQQQRQQQQNSHATTSSSSQQNNITANLTTNTNTTTTTSSSAPGSQPQVELDAKSASIFLSQLTERTSGCTIEQLEQLRREMMAEIWRLRGQANRIMVLTDIQQVFNEAIEDIEGLQGLVGGSQGVYDSR